MDGKAPHKGACWSEPASAPGQRGMRNGTSCRIRMPTMSGLWRAHRAVPMPWALRCAGMGCQILPLSRGGGGVQSVHARPWPTAGGPLLHRTGPGAAAGGAARSASPHARACVFARSAEVPQPLDRSAQPRILHCPPVERNVNVACRRSHRDRYRTHKKDNANIFSY